MKYETPELTVLTPAINAIQGFSGNAMKLGPAPVRDNKGGINEHVTVGYADWE